MFLIALFCVLSHVNTVTTTVPAMRLKTTRGHGICFISLSPLCMQFRLFLDTEEIFRSIKGLLIHLELF